jgi:hypothetical protein
MVVVVLVVAVGVVIGCVVSPGFRKGVGVLLAVLAALGAGAAAASHERDPWASSEDDDSASGGVYQGYQRPGPLPLARPVVNSYTSPPLGTHACGTCGLPHNLDPSVQHVTARAVREVRREQHVCDRCHRLHTVSVWN